MGARNIILTNMVEIMRFCVSVVTKPGVNLAGRPLNRSRSMKGIRAHVRDPNPQRVGRSGAAMAPSERRRHDDLRRRALHDCLGSEHR